MSRPQRQHILNVHLWIDNVHVFIAYMVNPGTRTGRHSDIVTLLAHGCGRCDWLTFLGGVFSESAWRVMYFSTFFFLITHIGMESLLR